MEICMLSELFYPFVSGGGERRYYEIAKRLTRNHNVTVYSLNVKGSPKQETVGGVKIIRVGAAHPRENRSLAALPSFAPALLKTMKAEYDIVDANQGIASFSGALKPLVHKPVVATFHDLYMRQWNRYFRFPFSLSGRVMEKSWSMLPYTKIISVSPGTEKKLRAAGFRSPVGVIPSGIDLDFVHGVKACRAVESVIFVGRLVKYKNVDQLIHAFKSVKEQIPGATLRIVGTGPEETSLRRLAKSEGVDAEFYGFVPESEKIRLIKSSSVLVNPSDVEGLGLILLEGMACGTPVVAKKLDSYFFCDGRNSVLYGNDIGKAIVIAFEKGKQLSKNGIVTAGKYSWDATARKVEKLYESVMP